jgi:succinate dehydrogenase hydrophobic anchor subunit
MFFSPLQQPKRHGWLVACVSAVLLALITQSAVTQAATTAGSPPRAVIAFTITYFADGTVNLTRTNVTVWNDYPVDFADSLLFSVSSMLNQAVGSAGATTTNATATPEPESDDGMAVWLIILIAVGGVALVVAIALGIYYGVVLKNKTPQAAGYDQITPATPGSRVGSLANGNKIIQIALVHPGRNNSAYNPMPMNIP